ncbi:hypothetical protein E2C01_011230 [Portunus trituberculatus]|uniref:Uncharacterized protein n=1 Tax=Portunus trituberculatus TaxID=210409 RepID=A0A5B7DAJ6_PORTR|nr:hypothetical protein [Portunus trituberculatus]
MQHHCNTHHALYQHSGLWRVNNAVNDSKKPTFRHSALSSFSIQTATQQNCTQAHDSKATMKTLQQSSGTLCLCVWKYYTFPYS